MSLFGKKGRDPSQLPTLSYDIPLIIPKSVDIQPQEISFLDLITNDHKFKNDKESLELVLSSYIKACGKQSVKEILAECDSSEGEKSSLADVIRALMDFNDQQNADLGVGYNDPEDDDSFIDDSTAAQDIIPKNMTNERAGFYVNEKHQPIKARYLSESSGSGSEDLGDDSDDSSDDEEDDDDDDDDESDDDDTSSASEKDQQEPKNNSMIIDVEEKLVKKRKHDDESHADVKRKRSVSDVTAPVTTSSLPDKTSMTKTTEETVKKIKKLSETAGESYTQINVTPAPIIEFEQELKQTLEKIIKLILSESTAPLTLQKKIERLFSSTLSRELLDLAKKLQRHTNATRQIAFDVLGAKTGILSSLLITRTRSLLLNDYEPAMKSVSINELREKLRPEIQRALEAQMQLHNQAVSEWQQKSMENPSKEKNRGPRKHFRFNKIISELIIRCIDRQLATFTLIDNDSLEIFLQDNLVHLWDKPGWMTAKKIINEVIRMEYRPLRDLHPSMLQSTPTTNQSISLTPKVSSVPATAERVKKDSTNSTSPIAKSSHSQSSPKLVPPQSTVRTNDLKANEQKTSTNSSNVNQTVKQLDMATRVSNTSVKTSASRPNPADGLNSSGIDAKTTSKTHQPDLIRSTAKVTNVSPTPLSDLSTKRVPTSNPSAAVIDLTFDSILQHKKPVQENSSSAIRVSSQSSTSKDSSPSNKISSPSMNAKQQQTPSFATKASNEKHLASSYLKDALLPGALASTPPKTASAKVSASPLAVDNMLNRNMQSPKLNSPSTSTKTSATGHTHSNALSLTQSSSSSSKPSPHHSSVDLAHPGNVTPKDKLSLSNSPAQTQKPKTSSSHRSSSHSTAPSNNVPSSSRHSTSTSLTSTFPTTSESQLSRGHLSQNSLTSALNQSIQWDPATLQLAAAAALANPQLLNSSVFDSHLFNSMLATAANIVSSSSSGSTPSSSSSSSRQQHSQNSSSQRRH